jgi:hypothetical protein
VKKGSHHEAVDELTHAYENEKARERFLAWLEMTNWHMAVISNERERSFLGRFFFEGAHEAHEENTSVFLLLPS